MRQSGTDWIFVSPLCYNTHMNKYTKYIWVCTGDCDALIEYTCIDGYGFPNGVMQYTCPCGSNCTLVSVVDATIVPSTKEKETPNMENETMNALPLSDFEKYDPTLLITYKKINGYSEHEFITDSIKNIEWELSNSRHNSRAVSLLQNNIDSVKDIIAEAYQDSGDTETLCSIAEALGIELTKQISFSATITVEGNITVSLVEDYDLDSLLSDELTVDSSNGDIEVEDYTVDNVRESF